MRRRKKSGWRRILSLVMEALFPRFCVGCGKEGSYICEDCSLFLSESRPLCPSCGRESRFSKAHRGCKGELDGLISLWDYEGIAKIAIERVKNGTFHIIEETIEFFIIIAQRDPKRLRLFLEILLDSESALVFVPLASGRRKKRGFDQAEIIAKHLALISDKEKSCLLKRTRETNPQFGLDRRERFLNVKGAFSVSGSVPDRIVLVDDLWASGATMKECGRVLKEAGAKEVWGFVLTRGE